MAVYILLNEVNMKTLLIIILLCLSSSLYCQNSGKSVKKYYQLINKAELFICDSNYNKAMNCYERAFKKITCPFSMDVYNCFKVCLMLNVDSITINSLHRELISREYEMALYKNMFVRNIQIFPGYLKVDTNAFLTAPALTKEKMTLDSFLRVDQDVRSYFYSMLDSVDEAAIMDSMWHVDSINCISLVSYLWSDFPDEKIGKLGFNPYDSPLYTVVFQHYSYRDYTTIYDSLLLQKIKTGEFHPEWYQNLYYKRQCADGWSDLYGYPIAYTKYKNEPERGTELTAYGNYKSKTLRRINRNRKRILLESYQDYYKKSMYEFNTGRKIMYLTFNENVVIQK